MGPNKKTLPYIKTFIAISHSATPKRKKTWKKIGVGETKRVERFSIMGGGTQLFKLNLGIGKGKNGNSEKN